MTDAKTWLMENVAELRILTEAQKAIKSLSAADREAVRKLTREALRHGHRAGTSDASRSFSERRKPDPFADQEFQAYASRLPASVEKSPESAKNALHDLVRMALRDGYENGSVKTVYDHKQEVAADAFADHEVLLYVDRLPIAAA